MADYKTKDFERTVSLRQRTRAIARHLAGFMRKTDRFAKTIVFCVDQEHALDMRQELQNLNDDLGREHPDYVCRVTSDEGAVGLGHLDRFKDVETKTPVIVTTSQLLTTGVDVPTCQNIVLVRVIQSMTEFKQIIGRGTRLRDDYGKSFFNILDYTGSATRLFADETFDGEPALITEVTIDDEGNERSSPHTTWEASAPPPDMPEPLTPRSTARASLRDDPSAEPRKYYFDGGIVEIRKSDVTDLDAEGHFVRSRSLPEYAGEQTRACISSQDKLRACWRDTVRRAETIARLHARGINLDDLAGAVGCPQADPLDLLAHIAFGAPLRTYSERAASVCARHADFFDSYMPEARAILLVLLEKYTLQGLGEFALPDALKVPPLSDGGSVAEIVARFGGAAALCQALDRLQELLYDE